MKKLLIFVLLICAGWTTAAAQNPNQEYLATFQALFAGELPEGATSLRRDYVNNNSDTLTWAVALDTGVRVPAIGYLLQGRNWEFSWFLFPSPDSGYKWALDLYWREKREDRWVQVEKLSARVQAFTREAIVWDPESDTAILHYRPELGGYPAGTPEVRKAITEILNEISYQHAEERFALTYGLADLAKETSQPSPAELQHWSAVWPYYSLAIPGEMQTQIGYAMFCPTEHYLYRQLGGEDKIMATSIFATNTTMKVGNYTEVVFLPALLSETHMPVPIAHREAAKTRAGQIYRKMLETLQQKK